MLRVRRLTDWKVNGWCIESFFQTISDRNSTTFSRVDYFLFPNTLQSLFSSFEIFITWISQPPFSRFEQLDFQFITCIEGGELVFVSKRNIERVKGKKEKQLDSSKKCEFYRIKPQQTGLERNEQTNDK